MSFKDSLNKHYAHTQNSVKKYEVGGKVVTKKGSTNDAKKGGYFDGRRPTCNAPVLSSAVSS